jgi:hypothetical protein
MPNAEELSEWMPDRVRHDKKKSSGCFGGECEFELADVCDVAGFGKHITSLRDMSASPTPRR